MATQTPRRDGPTTVGNTATTVATGPGAGVYYVVREITVTSRGSASVTFSLGVGTSNTDAMDKHWRNAEVCSLGDPWEWSGTLILAGHATTPDLLYGIGDVASGGSAGLNVTVVGFNYTP